MKKIYANLKMNMDYNMMKDYLDNIKSTTNLIIFPSHPFLGMFKENFTLGAQDVSVYQKGSYTGDIAAFQLASLNCQYVIIGHSERRKYYKENNEIITTKINNTLENNLKVILCVGEDENEDRNQTLLNQLEVLKNIQSKDIIIAYEPVWAIGTGKIPTNEEIQLTANFIKKHYDFPILYGGSVDENNIEQLNQIDIAGFLVGKASCDAKKLNKMLEIIER